MTSARTTGELVLVFINTSVATSVCVLVSSNHDSRTTHEKVLQWNPTRSHTHQVTSSVHNLQKTISVLAVMNNDSIMNNTRPAGDHPCAINVSYH